MKSMQEWFEPLKKEDIEEKIKLNLEKMSLEKFREELYSELFMSERKALEVENGLILRKIQGQNIKEQIKVVEEMLRPIKKE